jgi:hypothetical protein
MGPQSCKVLIVGISKLPLRSLATKCHLNVTPMERRIEYYKGEGGGFPQVQAVVSLVSSKLPVVRPSTKSASNYALTNLLFGLCRPMSLISLLVILPSPIPELQHALLPKEDHLGNHP